ncbi:MAG TPA: hypothetical protein PLF40_00560 [Kofleriaceae bacterium]|mgnify:CR=1 FL=1|nr:hypothetical protein [Kofleriaceae bacterium]
MALESLPPAAHLLQRSKALACLDAILCPEWEHRYYSFNAQWAPNEQMASMRNGCGDEWFMLFDAQGRVGLKGFAHESDAWAQGRNAYSATLQRAVPSTLYGFAKEPAFRWDCTTFVYVAADPHVAPQRLHATPAIDALDNGAEVFLQHLTGDAASYVVYAAEYFEIQVDVALVGHVFALKPLTDEVVAALGSERTLDELADDLKEIDYPMT